VEQGARLNVPAALDCRERRATYDCERQRGSRSGCGLSDAGARGARVARRCHHTSWATSRRRLVAETSTVVEAPTPRRQEQPVALNPATHVSEVCSRSFADRGSIPRASTPELQHANGRRVPCSENTASLQGRAVVARLAHNQEAAGSTPAPATTETVPLVGGSTHGGSAKGRQPVREAFANRFRAVERSGSTPTEGWRPSRSATRTQSGECGRSTVHAKRGERLVDSRPRESDGEAKEPCVGVTRIDHPENGGKRAATRVTETSAKPSDRGAMPDPATASRVWVKPEAETSPGGENPATDRPTGE
jgi:hypothetical protein